MLKWSDISIKFRNVSKFLNTDYQQNFTKCRYIYQIFPYQTPRVRLTVAKIKSKAKQNIHKAAILYLYYNTPFHDLKMYGASVVSA